MHTTGACFCGELEYEAKIDPNFVSICHCRDCQIMSGSAFRISTGLAPEDFKITKGTANIFAKTADSGNVRRLAFCGTCGTHIAALPPEGTEGGIVFIRVASSNDFEQLKPIGEIWCQSKVNWMPDIKGATKFARTPK